MKQFLLTLPWNIIGCFKGRNIFWHLTAIILTWILVTSGFDWFYFQSTRSRELRSWMFPAVIIGGLLPMTLPFLLLLIGVIFRSAIATRAGWATGQAALLGLAISSAYKVITGRPHPPRGTALDMSHVFRFGFMRGGIFWGWPSSHTTIAFAMAVSVFILFPEKKWLRIAAILYACYIGIGVSMTIHWFSDFAAGAIIGMVVGTTVGKSFAAPAATMS
jgi:membrane-associated phospholipid phosphatase